MNDDYRLVLTGDSSDLESSLKAIELYMGALESKDIDAPLNNFLKKLKVVAKEVKNVQGMMKKQDGKSFISAKDMDNSIKSTRTVTKNINDLKKALDDIQTENISKGITPDPNVEKAYAKLSKVLNETQDSLSSMSTQKIGTDASVRNRIKDMETLNKVTKEYKRLTKDTVSTNDYTKRLRANRNMTRNYMEKSEGTKHLTYDQGARVQRELGKIGTYQTQYEQNQRKLAEARKQYSSYAQKQQDLTSQKSKGLIDNKAYEDQLATIKSEMKAREKLINSYSKLDSELEKTISYYSGSVQNEVKNRDIDQKRGTIGRMVQERLPSIGSHAGMAMTGMVGGLYFKGASLSEANRPMVTSLGQNSNTMNIDAVRSAYQDLSLDNSLGYNSTDMLKMATSYESAVGHKSDADTMEGTKQLAIGGRSLGIRDQESYQESMNQIMHTGGVDSRNMKAMQDAFLGGIKQSGMLGRQEEQLKALGSIAEQSGQGRTLTKDEMGNLTAMQATFAESGSKGLQGAQGASVMNSIDQGIKNGMSNPYTRIAMGWGTQYQGLEGGYDLQKRMDKGISDPENLTDMVGMATQMGGSKKEQEYIFNRSLKEMGANLTLEQSDEIFKDAQSGKLSKEELSKKVKQMQKEGDKQGKKNEDEYKDSRSGRNDQNKARRDDKAEDTYDMAQPLRDAHSAIAKLPAPIYVAIGAIGAFSASLLASALQLGGGHVIGKGAKGLRNVIRKRKGGSSPEAPMSGGIPSGGSSPKGGSPKGGSPKGGGSVGGGSRWRGFLDGAKSFGDTLIGGESKRGGTRSGKDQAKGMWNTTKNVGRDIFDTFRPKNRDFTFGEYMKRTKDLGKKGIDVGKEATKDSIFTGLPSLGKKAMERGKGLFGKLGKASKGGSKLGIMSQSPMGMTGFGGLGEALGGLGKFGGLARGASKLLPGVGWAMTAMDVGSKVSSGKSLNNSLEETAEGIIDPIGLGYGKKLFGASRDENKPKNSLWSNGDSKGKGGFKDSIIGKPLSKMWGGFTSLFSSDDAEASEKDDKKTFKGLKGNKISYILIALLIK